MPGNRYGKNADGKRVVKFTFHPGEVVEFTLDWIDRLVEDDTLITATFVVDPVILGVEFFSPTYTANAAQVWMRGTPALGSLVTAVCHVTTAAGRQLQQSFLVEVLNP